MKKVKYAMIRLRADTRSRLNAMLLEVQAKRGEKMSANDLLVVLMDSYEQKRGDAKKGGETQK